jgi:hypothetical protein
MGANGASNGGSADAPNTTRSTLSAKNQAKADKKSRAEANVEVGLGQTKTQRAVETVGNFIKGGGLVGAAVRGVTNAVRRGRVNTSLMGTSDYQGSTTRSNVGDLGRGDGGGQSNIGAATSSGVVVQSPTVTAPTTAEVSQVSAAEAEDPILLRKRKTLARGRSITIATTPTGATGSLTLGKPSLLGR